MQLWTLPYPQSAPSGAPPADAGLTLAMIDAIGRDDFAQRVLSLVNHTVPFGSWSIYRVGTAHPQMFLSGSHHIPDTTQDCWQAYCATGLYRCDQTVDRARERLSAGTLLLTHWRAEEIHPPHRQTVYERHGLRERFSLLSHAVDRSILAINFYRHAHEPALRPTEVRDAEHLAPLLQACVEKHLSLITPATSPKLSIDGEALRAAILRRCPKMPSREVQVCERLALGLTYDGIAADLGISATTAKTYRNRAFHRLNIRHRNQLFGLLLDAN